jgi:hypothetical protein
VENPAIAKIATQNFMARMIASNPTPWRHDSAADAAKERSCRRMQDVAGDMASDMAGKNCRRSICERSRPGR